MKKLITICLVVLLVLGTGVAFANGGGGDKVTVKDSVIGCVDDSVIVGRNNHGTVAGGDIVDVDIRGGIKVKGGDVDVDNVNCNSNENINKNKNESTSSVTQDISYEDRVQGVSPQLPWQLWHGPTPEEKFLWNQLGVDVEELIAIEWTLKKAKNLAKRGGWFNENYKNRTVVFLDDYPRNKCKLILSLRVPSSSEAVFAGEVHIDGKKKLETLTCIGEAIELSMEKGAHIAVLKHGINTINNGTAAGIGGTYVNSSGDAAGTGLASLGSADSRKQGEPAVILVCYRKVETQEAAE